MARGSWQQPAVLAAMSAAPNDDDEQLTPDDFNPFLAGKEKNRTSNLAPYDPQYLERLQG